MRFTSPAQKALVVVVLLVVDLGLVLLFDALHSEVASILLTTLQLLGWYVVSRVFRGPGEPVRAARPGVHSPSSVRPSEDRAGARETRRWAASTRPPASTTSTRLRLAASPMTEGPNDSVRPPLIVASRTPQAIAQCRIDATMFFPTPKSAIAWFGLNTASTCSIPPGAARTTAS